jgi:hypothetical protein
VEQEVAEACRSCEEEEAAEVEEEVVDNEVEVAEMGEGYL